MNLSIALAVTGLGSSLPGFVAPRTAPTPTLNAPALPGAAAPAAASFITALPAVVAPAKAVQVPAAAAVPAAPAAVAPAAALRAAPKAGAPLAALVSGRAPLTVFDGGFGKSAPASPVLEGANTPAPRLNAAVPARPAARTSPADLPGRTPLEKHAAYFDEDGDGVITVWETRRRLRLLGFGQVKAAAVALAIHVALAPSTSNGGLDLLKLNIRVANIHRGRHAGDTGVYDAEGRFVPEQFERIFSRFALSRPGQMNEGELRAMIVANAARKPGPLAIQAASAEFGLLFDIAADRTDVVDGKPVRAISRERLEQFYDGTLFYRLTGL